MENVIPKPKTVKALLLPKQGEPIETFIDANSLIFTGIFISVRGYSKEFDSEAKACFNRNFLGGIYIKSGMQPEEAHELAKRYPGKVFGFELKK